MQEILLKIKYCERGSLKTLKKVFLLHPVSFYEQKGSGTSHQSLFKLQNIFRKFPGQFSSFNTKWFLNYSKNYICSFIKTISQRHNYSSFMSLLGSDKCGKKGKKIQKYDYLETEKSFLDEIKSNFRIFEMLSFGKI